jgi:hypothetical protein
VVGLQHAERAHRIAIERARKGDVAGAREILNRVAGRIAEYAGDDPALLQAVEGLRQAGMEFDRRGYAPAMAKEAYFASQARSRGQRDLRGRLKLARRRPLYRLFLLGNEAALCRTL